MPPHQETSSPRSFSLSPKMRRGIMFAFAILVVLRVALIFQIPFTDTTEARYAEMARKMVETNDWISPQFQYNVPFWGKPPLHTWVSAVGMKIFGINGFGARIFIFLTACAIIVGLMRWGKREKGSDYALAGSFIVASSILFNLASATVMTDMVMIAGTSLSMIAFWDLLHRENQPLWRRYLFFVGLAIGMLAKGPVAVVLTAIPIALWVLMTNRWVDTWKKVPWLTGTLLTLALFLPWYIAAEMKTPGFIEYFIVGEHFKRFVDSGWDGDLYGHAHARMRGTIWLNALGDGLPWTPFVLLPLLWIKKVTLGIWNESNKWTLYLACWVAAPMLFFTMATNTIATYALPGLPAFGFLALNLWGLVKSPNNPPSRGWVRFYSATAAFAVIIPTIALVGLIANPRFLEHRSQKWVIEKINDLDPQGSGHIYYWHSRYYSAEFYSAGKAITLKEFDDLPAMLTNDQRDFFVIKKKYLSAIPPEIINHFSPVPLNSKKMLLFQERP